MKRPRAPRAGGEQGQKRPATRTPGRKEPPQRRGDASARGSASKPARGWCVYLLRCADGSLYTGATNCLVERLARHNAGKGAAYTRSRLPVCLAYSEDAADRSAALRREAAIKRLSRARKLELIGPAS